MPPSDTPRHSQAREQALYRCKVVRASPLTDVVSLLEPRIPSRERDEVNSNYTVVYATATDVYWLNSRSVDHKAVRSINRASRK